MRISSAAVHFQRGMESAPPAVTRREQAVSTPAGVRDEHGHVRVSLSDEAHKELQRADQAQADGVDADSETGELTEAERQEVSELQKRDAEVRAHEQAHMAAAGGHSGGGPVFEYQTGPDGQRYAVGGSVDIDTSAVPGDPAATIAKANAVRRAALAPASPSGQDRAVAARAARTAASARSELAEQQQPGAAGHESAADSELGAGGPRRSAMASSRAVAAYQRVTTAA